MSNGFFMSAALHASIVALILLSTCAFPVTQKPPTKIFELVAGKGDNYGATVAPKLGEPGGVKVDLPKLPARKPEPQPQPVAEVPKPEPAPVAPAPTKEKAPAPTKEKAPPVAKAPPKERTMKEQLQRKLVVADANAKRQVAREREAEQKRLAKEEADRLAREKAAKTPPKFQRIDTEGIKSGVIGGSTANKQGGAGGNALTVDERSEVEGYTAMLVQRLQEYLNNTPGLDDGLKAEVEVHIMADGRLTRPQIVKSSKNEAFDVAVLRAVRSVKMPDRPKGLDEVQTIPFSTRAKN